MKYLVTKQKTKLAVIALTLILQFQVYQSRELVATLSWRVEALQNAVLSYCEPDYFPVGQRLSDAFAAQAEFSQISIASVFFEAGSSGPPTCAQMNLKFGFDHIGDRKSEETWHLTLAVQQNTAQDVSETDFSGFFNQTQYYQNKAGITSDDGTRDLGQMIEAAIAGVTVPQGMAIFSWRIS